ncbi:MAG: DNA internalization-related competence protein ComEC/Rec2 [bacterium]|nr:DNA internalization-related competence protein ComEC/Rec2 [bacterium]
MLKLRTILLSNTPYYVLLIITILISTIKLTIPKQSKYSLKQQEIAGTIININQQNNQVKLIVKAKELVLATYYLKENEIFTYQLGEKVKLTGTLTRPKKNTTPNLFNYQQYLEHKNIFFLLKTEKVDFISTNKNPYFYLKQKLINYLAKNPYLLTFIIGDKTNISQSIIKSYQKNGISHLFSISGMHITLLSSLILKLLKKIKISENKCYLITSFFLIAYLNLANQSASILRGVLFFIFFSLNKIYYFHIKPVNIFILTLSISLLINENYIYDLGFWYSYSISLALILLTKSLGPKNYLFNLLATSIISFIASIPISIYNFYEINFLSIIYNLFFVPLVSIIIFPMSLITFIFPFFLPIFNFLTKILENLSLLLSSISFATFSFPKLKLPIYFLYLLFSITCLYGLYSHQKKLIIPLILLLFFHYFYPYFIKDAFLDVLDIGQGDSILFHENNTTILIDTGGLLAQNKASTESSLTETVTIPYLKSSGIRKINYLILTHGDYDHMGETINLVNKFKVENVIFNCGEYNTLEKEVIKVLDKKKINYYSCLKELNIGKHQLQFLNTGIYDNENDNSNVIYFNYNNYKFLFMGDAGVRREKDILAKYNLKDIDFLKVGHHGSNTSSSEYFINKIKPKYSLISVGANNRYNHPQKIVLEILKNSKIYRTDQDGSIKIKLNKNDNMISTCPP